MKKSFLNLGIHLFVIIWMLSSCNNSKNMESKRNEINRKSINDIPTVLWDRLSNSKIYFGHQSVGSNIISGIEDILKDNQTIRLKIRTYNTNLKEIEPGLYHEKIGLNKQPATKIAGFCKSLDSGVGEKMDMAFFKFCYVDFNSSTQVSDLFKEYKRACDNYTLKYPKLKIIHITVPLRVRTKGLKGMIDIMRGKDQNKKRCEYNKLLIKGYGTKNVFDLAFFESAYADGTREGEGNVYALIPEYTDDGGHLNMQGRKIIAEQLLIFLATYLTD